MGYTIKCAGAFQVQTQPSTELLKEIYDYQLETYENYLWQYSDVTKEWLCRGSLGKFFTHDILTVLKYIKRKIPLRGTFLWVGENIDDCGSVASRFDFNSEQLFVTSDSIAIEAEFCSH